MSPKIILADLPEIFKWVLCGDGMWIIDPKYIDEWRDNYGKRCKNYCFYYAN